MKKIVLMCVLMSSGLVYAAQTSLIQPMVIEHDLATEEIHWDWSTIDTSRLSFPQKFLLGTGTSAWQVDGPKNCPHSNWSRYEQRMQQGWWNSDKEYPVVPEENRCGAAANHWNRLQEDTQLMKNIGVNASRFSLSWSEIEPAEGQFNHDAVKHYHEEIDILRANGIVPMITLVHFDVPTWFEDKGGFEKAENIWFFVRFCTEMFAEFHDKVDLWITINEPGVVAFQTYFRGVYPPAKRSMGLTAEVTKNLMLAHVAAYQTMKKMPGGDKAMIGIVHDIVQYEPYHPGNGVELAMTNIINHIFHEAITNFFITRKFQFYFPIWLQPLFGLVPATADASFELEANEKILDFIGLNYYSHVLWNWQNPAGSSYRPGDIPTDMPYGIYPEGLYRAIDTCSKMGVPIYITENGLADAKDDRREQYLKQYLYVVSKAIKDGYDVRGYFYWSLYDNCEWDMHLDGDPKSYGLYTTNFTTFEHTLRPSAYYYMNVIDDWRKAYNNEVLPFVQKRSVTEVPTAVA